MAHVGWLSRTRRSALVAVLTLIPVVPAAPCFAAPRQDTQKRVLAIHPGRREMPALVTVDVEVQRVLSAALGSRLDYYAEHIDMGRFPEREYQLALRDFLRHKYGRTSIDVVIATSNGAFEFARDNRDLLFPGAAIVAFFNPSGARAANSTGVSSGINFRGTLDLALTLQPEITQVFVVSGAAEFDRFYEDIARSQFQQYTNRLTFNYLTGLAMDVLEERLAHLPERSIVYFLMVTSDSAGQQWLPLDSLDRAIANANAPVYHWLETAIDHGVIGGSVMTIALPARVMAGQAVRIINGEPADSLPVQEVDPNVVTIDWRQLRRWNISEARLPATAVVRFRELTTWQAYRIYIVGAVSLVVLQTVLIGILVVNRASRRRAEVALRDSYARIRDLAGRLIHAQEVERASIARDLHDDVGQRVASFSIALGTLKRRLDGADDVVRADLASLQRETTALSKDLRLLSHELHPGLLQQLGLVEALRARCDELQAEAGLAVRFDVGPEIGVVSDEISLCLYRVAQEALRNVVTHAQAQAARLSLARHDGHLSLRVSDDGCGLGSGQISAHRGLGLVSLEERVRMLDGTFTVDSSERSGTTVSVTIPCDDSNATTARAVGR